MLDCRLISGTIARDARVGRQDLRKGAHGRRQLPPDFATYRASRAPVPDGVFTERRTAPIIARSSIASANHHHVFSGRSPHLTNGKSETSMRFQKKLKVLGSSTTGLRVHTRAAYRMIEHRERGPPAAWNAGTAQRVWHLLANSAWHLNLRSLEKSALLDGIWLAPEVLMTTAPQLASS
jgi:hypothetical protein